MPDHDMWCWECRSSTHHTEVSRDIWRCVICSTDRDLTDPDEVRGVAGD